MREIEAKVKICRGSLGGTKFVDIFVGGAAGNIPNSHYNASRQLTGTTCEDQQGVFTSSKGPAWVRVEMSYGDHSKVFKWPPIDILQTPASMLCEDLRFRIAEVRDWVRSLDREEILNFTFPTELGLSYSPPQGSPVLQDGEDVTVTYRNAFIL